MASNYTSNYRLCQWAAEDKVLRTDFNADNAKIDAAIKAVNSRVDSLSSTVSGKASASALNDLTVTVNGLKTSKADKSALDSLSQTVLQHTTSLAGKGNCQLYSTTYTGTGGCGSDSQNSLTFPHKPFAVFLVSGNYSIALFQGVTGVRGIGSAYLTLSWSGSTLRWYSTSALDQLNQQGSRYLVFALLEL